MFAPLLPTLAGEVAVAQDGRDRLVLLFASQWELQYFERKHPEVQLLAESPVDALSSGR